MSGTAIGSIFGGAWAHVVRTAAVKKTNAKIARGRLSFVMFISHFVSRVEALNAAMS
jgi:hypothetical protein